MDIDGAAVQAMLDKEAIREVSLRYTRGIDRHDADLLRSAYHADACDDHGAFIGSGAEFVDYANRTHAQNWGTHQHHVTNQLIDLDGETAHCESYFFAILKRSDSICDLVGGRYIDRIDKRSGVWAVADRICMVEWNIEGRPGEAPLDPTLFVCGAWDRSDPSYRRPLRVERAPRDLGLGQRFASPVSHSPRRRPGTKGKP